MNKIQKLLFELEDKKYGNFIQGLTPTHERSYFIGVRVPEIRKIAKEIKYEDAKDFLNELPHKYYEENLLHGFIIQKIKDYEEALKEIIKFLPYVDSWAVSDTITPKVFIKHTKELLPYIKKWLKSKETYTIRFGIILLMDIYLDNDFDVSQLELVSQLRSKEYYVNMAIAWYFATALAKRYKETLPYIKEKKLDDWCHNKAIQKAIESYRITDEQKELLRKLKVVKK